MNKRRSPRQQKPRTAKVQNETQPQTSGPKRSRKKEENTPKQDKASKKMGIRKRKISFEEKSSKKHKDSDDTHDSYCWKCHNYCQDEKCSTCNRVYCFKCYKGDVNQVCEACLRQNASEDAFSKIADTSSLLLSVIETSFPENKIRNKRLFNWQPKETEEKLCHIVDYTYIDSKSKDTDGLQYRSPAELLDDVKWMHHNCVILYGEHHDITKEAKKIMEQFALEIEDLSDCAECYRKRFLNICDTPHPLIMAKQRYHPPWPAKCLRVVDSKAHVRYFGLHQMAKVPLKDCFFVSENHIGQKKSKSFEEAKQEFHDYIQLFEETFGEEYPYQPKGTPYNEEIGKDLMKRVKERYQRAQKNSRTSESTSQTVTQADYYRDSKSAVDLQSHLQPSVESLDMANFSSNHLIQTILASLPGSPLSPFNANNTFPSVSPNTLPHGSSIPYNPQTRSNSWLLPTYNSQMPNESGISISNVYSGSDPHAVTSLDLNAQDPAFLISDSPHNIQTVPNLAMPPPYTSTETENNVREDSDDDIEVIEEISSDPQHRSSVFKNVDESVVQAILCRNPAAYSILQAANDLVRQLFLQFWAIANNMKNAPAILASQKEKIQKLKKDKAELLNKLTKSDDRVANADSILRSVYAMKCDSLQQKNNALLQQNKELEEQLSNMSKELVNVEHYKTNCVRYQEAAKDYKKNNYCTNCIDSRASMVCCINGHEVTSYCSSKCQKEHESIHSKFCSRQKQNPGEYKTQAPILTAEISKTETKRVSLLLKQ